MIAALLLASLGAVSAPPTDTTFIIERGGHVVIEHPEGNIEVRGTRGREARVLVDGEIRGVRVSRAGSVYHIGAGAFWQDAGSGLILELPSNVSLSIHGLEGDVRVRDVSDVTIETIDGSIEVSGADDVAVHAVDGDIHVEDAAGTVSAQNGDGDVRLERVSGPIEVNTIDGNVVVTGSGADAATLSTISGDVWYEGRLAAGGVYALDTHDGDVVLAVPRGAGARVSAFTFDGSFEPSFPVQFRSARSGATELTIGDGGARVTLESFDGDI